MNKVILTIESDDPRFVSRIMKALRDEETVTVSQQPQPIPESQAPAQEPAQAVVAQPPADSGAAQPPSEQETPKRTRKPRADAGKPRGPYKDTNGAGAGAAAGDPGAAGGSPAVQTAAVPAPAAPVAEKKLTHEAIRDHLGLINKTPGLGMAGCHAFLAGFVPTGASAPGVKRISDVKEEDFARFVAEIDARIAKFQAEGK